MPAPTANRNAPFKALLFDSWYDDYRGVVALMEIIDGCLKPGDRVGVLLCLPCLVCLSLTKTAVVIGHRVLA